MRPVLFGHRKRRSGECLCRHTCERLGATSVLWIPYRLETEPERHEQRVGLKRGGCLVDRDLDLSAGPLLAVSHDGDIASVGPDRPRVGVSVTEVQLKSFADRYGKPARQHPAAITAASVGNGGEGEFAARTRAKAAERIFRVGKPLNIAAQSVRCDPRPGSEERRYLAARRELPVRELVKPDQEGL